MWEKLVFELGLMHRHQSSHVEIILTLISCSTVELSFTTVNFASLFLSEHR